MTNKEYFIKIVDYCFDDGGIILSENFTDEEYTSALSFWKEFKEFKEGKVKESKGMTENGAKLLSWMKDNEEKMSNIFTSKEAAEALFTSGRSIAGSMRKLVNDGYVEKIGKDPVRYSLTEVGKNYQFDN